jgi:hypothetical protein
MYKSWIGKRVGLNLQGDKWIEREREMNGEVCRNVDTTNVTDERANTVIAVQKVMMSSEGYYFLHRYKGGICLNISTSHMEFNVD